MNMLKNTTNRIEIENHETTELCVSWDAENRCIVDPATKLDTLHSSAGSLYSILNKHRVERIQEIVHIRT